MKNTRIAQVSFAVLSIIALTFLAGGTSAAQELAVDHGILAVVTIEDELISWELKLGDAGFTLMISGPGDFHFVQQYAASALATLRSVDGEEDPLPDGTYAYELRLLPDELGDASEYYDERRSVARIEEAAGPQT